MGGGEVYAALQDVVLRLGPWNWWYDVRFSEGMHGVKIPAIEWSCNHRDEVNTNCLCCSYGKSQKKK